MILPWVAIFKSRVCDNFSFSSYRWRTNALPFSVEDKLHLEMRVAPSSDPLVDEDVHVFAGHHEDRTSERQRAHHLDT
jgi:hypothetical protein